MKFENISFEKLDIVIDYIKKNLIKNGATLLFNGDLGAGKTTLIKKLCASLGVDENLVTSPTFTILNEYNARNYKIYHMDFYRLSEDELLYLEIDNILESKKYIKFIEWSEKFKNYLPKNRINIYINYCDNNFDVRNYNISEEL